MPRITTPSLFALLLVLTVAAFLPLWNNEFVDYDDVPYITTNSGVYSGLSESGVDWALIGFGGSYWQPLSWLSLQLDAQFFSTPSPAGPPTVSARAIHLENLCWHAGSVLLLFAVIQRLTGARWRSFIVAAVFAVHPLRVESIAWASERKDVLSVFFGLLTVWVYAWYAKRGGWERYLVVVGAYLLCLCSKPMLMTLPLVLLLLDYWPLDRTAPAGRSPAAAGKPGRAPASRGWLVLEKVPLLVLAAAVGALTQLLRGRSGALVSLDVLPLSDRVANALTAYGWYLAHSLWPTGLAVLYPHPFHHWSLLGALAGTAALLLPTALAVWQVRRRPWLLVGWLWFVGTLVPVIGLSQGGAQAWADRFTYWPHIGLAVAFVWALAELVQRLRLSAALAGTAAALAVGCLAAATWVQVGYWHDTGTLWERDLAMTEGNHRAHFYLGVFYRDQGRLDRAAVHFAEAVRIDPDSIRYQHALSNTLESLDRAETSTVSLQGDRGSASQ